MRKWTIPLVATSTGTIVWWAHCYLTYAFPPFDNWGDKVLWVVVSVLKIATLVSIPIVLGRVLKSLHRDIRKTAAAAFLWLIVGSALLGSLTVLRGPLASVLDNDAARYFPTTTAHPERGGFSAADDFPAAVYRIQSGQVLEIEAGTILICVLGVAAIGFLVGRFGVWAGIGAAIWLFAVTATANYGFSLISWDYDVFLVGTFVPSAMDSIFPLANDPFTELAFLGYSAIIWSCFLLDWRLRPKAVQTAGA